MSSVPDQVVVAPAQVVDQDSEVEAPEVLARASEVLAQASEAEAQDPVEVRVGTLEQAVYWVNGLAKIPSTNTLFSHLKKFEEQNEVGRIS